MTSNKTVDVSKIKEKFSDRICSLYNQETFFIKDCLPNSSKYSIETQLRDLQLDIFLAENNKVDLCGTIVPYCSKNKSERTIKLRKLTINQPEVNVYNVTNNYIIQQDQWDEDNTSSW